MHHSVYQNETAIRLMLASTIARGAEGPIGDGVPLRQNRRTPLIDAALAPARPLFDDDAYARLRAALGLVFGSEFDGRVPRRASAGRSRCPAGKELGGARPRPRRSRRVAIAVAGTARRSAPSRAGTTEPGQEQTQCVNGCGGCRTLAKACFGSRRAACSPSPDPGAGAGQSLLVTTGSARHAGSASRRSSSICATRPIRAGRRRGSRRAAAISAQGGLELQPRRLPRGGIEPASGWSIGVEAGQAEPDRSGTGARAPSRMTITGVPYAGNGKGER